MNNNDLAKKHLHLIGNRIHVLQERQNSWQELITYIPPLILQTAFLHLQIPFTDDTIEGRLNYFTKVILLEDF